MNQQIFLLKKSTLPEDSRNK